MKAVVTFVYHLDIDKILRERKTYKPEVGSYWLHKSGDIYEVESYSNQLSTRQDEYPLLLNYRRLRDNSLWSKSVDGFIKSRIELPR